MMPVLEFFSADRPHGINGYWSREEPENDAFDLEKILESGSRNSGVLAAESFYRIRFILQSFFRLDRDVTFLF